MSDKLTDDCIVEVAEVWIHGAIAVQRTTQRLSQWWRVRPREGRSTEEASSCPTVCFVITPPATDDVNNPLIR
jgi:hypothetical protein